MKPTMKEWSSRLRQRAAAAVKWAKLHWKALAVLLILLLAAGKLREMELRTSRGPIITIAPNGVVETVNEVGASVSRHHTYKGLNHGHFEQRWPNGNFACLGFYSAGEQVGKWHWFDERGELIKFKDFDHE